MPQAARKVERHEVTPLSLRALVQPESINAEKRTADLIMSTGARVLRRDWWTGERFYEELSMDPKHVRLERMQNGAPMLNAHNQWDLASVIGVVEDARIENGQLVGTVRFSDREDVEPIWRDVQNGIIRSVSVGYRVHRFEQVEGGDEEIPVMRATDWEPFEVSPVPIPADAGAGFRSDGAQKNTCEIIFNRADDAHTETADMPDPIKNTAAGGQPDDPTRGQQPVVTPTQPTAEEIRAEAQRVERERSAGIRQAVRAAGLEESAADDMIQRGITLDAARAEVIAKLGEKDAKRGVNPNGGAVEAGEQERDKWLRGAMDWILTKASVAGMVQRADTNHKVDPQGFGGMSLVDLARESLERSGVRTRGMDKMVLVGTALTHRGLGGLHSTSDFAVLLENTMHKVLLAAYGTTPDTWRRFCAIGSVSDFRPHNRYRMGTFGTLDSLNESGEFKNKAIPDGSKELIEAATKGNIIGLTRQAIVNDDMGSFNRLAAMFGRAAALSIEVDVYAMLASNAGLGPTLNDGKTLFHADHGNIGTGAALSVEALDDDRVVMASQTDRSGNEYLDLRPAVMVLPIGLGGDARVINDAQYDPDTANKLQKPNKVRGLFRDLVDTPRLSGTRRYLFADPNVAPVLEVAFLDGQQSPFLENQQGWRFDGVEWKVRLDYGTAGIDYVGAVTNAGTP